MIYDVPGFIFGSPLYKYDDCVIYLENKLIKRDFEVKKTFPEKYNQNI